MRRPPAAVPALLAAVLLFACRAGPAPAPGPAVATAPVPALQERAELEAIVNGLSGEPLIKCLQNVTQSDAPSSIRGFAHLRLARLLAAEPSASSRPPALRHFEVAEAAFRETASEPGARGAAAREAMAEALLERARFCSLFGPLKAEGRSAVDRALACGPGYDLRLRLEMTRLSLLGRDPCCDERRAWRLRMEALLDEAPRTETWHAVSFALIRSAAGVGWLDDGPVCATSEPEYVLDRLRMLEAGATAEGRPWVEAAGRLVHDNMDRQARHAGLLWVPTSVAEVEFPAEVRDAREVVVYRAPDFQDIDIDDVLDPDLDARARVPVAHHALQRGADPWRMSSPGPGAFVVLFRGEKQCRYYELRVTDLAGISVTDGNRVVVQAFNRWNGLPLGGVVVQADVNGNEAPMNRGDRDLSAPGEGDEDRLGSYRFRGVTDADGQWTYAVPFEGYGFQLEVTIERGAERWVLDCDHRPAEREPELQVFAHADRPVYRPGETVSWRAVLRVDGAECTAVPQGDAFQISIHDSASHRTLYSGLQNTDAWGVVHGKLRLPEDAPLTDYWITVQPVRPDFPRNEKVSSEGENKPLFFVEAYRLPEFRVEVRLPDQPLRPGALVEAEVEVRYYFGSPVPEAEGRLEVGFQEEPAWNLWSWLDEPAAGWYVQSDTPRDVWWLPSKIYTPLLTVPFMTDREGIARVAVRIPPSRGRDRTYLFVGTVQDSTGESVSGQVSRKIDAAPVRLALSSSTHGGRVGEPVTVRVQATGTAGRPAAVPVRVSLGLEGGAGAMRGGDDEVEARTDADSGVVEVTLRPRRPGWHVIVARTVTDREAEAVGREWLWVSGGDRAAGSASQPGTSSKPLAIILETPRVVAGQPGKALIALPDGAQGAFIAFGWGRLDRWLYLRGDGAIPFEFPTSVALSPRTALLAATFAHGRLHMAHQVVVVEDPAEMLEVRIRPDRETYGPGMPVRAEIEVVDGSGRPAEAEIGLSVVDEKIYAVRPDPLPPMAQVIRRRAGAFNIDFGSAGEADDNMPARGGLAGATFCLEEPRAVSVADVPLRRDFSATACWLPALRTDAAGRAVAEFRLPDSLTEWRFTARAVGGGYAVGESRRGAVARKDLMVRLAAPRMLRERDRCVLRATVHNETDRDRDVALAFEAEGVRVESAPPARVRVPARGTAGVDWPVVAEAPGRAVFRAVARAADDGGGGRPPEDGLEVGIPVLPHAVEEVVSRRVRVMPGRTRIELPRLEGTVPTEGKIVLAGSRLHAVREALPGLVGYPYG